jgi:hypothetical protein
MSLVKTYCLCNNCVLYIIHGPVFHLKQVSGTGFCVSLQKRALSWGHLIELVSVSGLRAVTGFAWLQERNKPVYSIHYDFFCS